MGVGVGVGASAAWFDTVFGLSWMPDPGTPLGCHVHAHRYILYKHAHTHTYGIHAYNAACLSLVAHHPSLHEHAICGSSPQQYQMP